MLRCIRRIIVFLLLGAVLNVLVAWGCALHRILYPDTETLYLSTDAKALYGLDVEHWLGCESLCVVRSDFGTIPIIPSLFPNAIKTPMYRGTIWWPKDITEDTPFEYFAAGWPMLSVKSWEPDGWLSLPSMNPPSRQSLEHCAFVITIGKAPSTSTSGPPYEVVLPYCPIAIGFAFDTIFDALFLLMLVHGWPAIRRTVRRRRKQCETCGYPRNYSGSPVCTECGKSFGRAS